MSFVLPKMAAAVCLSIMAGASSPGATKGQQRTVSAVTAPETLRGADRLAARELAAQERTAAAAEWQILISALGLLGLGLTVVYARKAWAESRRAATASSQAVEVAQDTARRQLRAYVVVDDVEIKDFGGESPSVTFRIINTGLTPARRLRYSGSVFWCLTEEVEDNLKRQPDPSEKSTHTLGAGRSVHPLLELRGNPFSSEGMRMFSEKRGRMVMHGHVNYEDIYGEAHVTQYRLYFRPQGDGQTGRFRFDEAGNASD